MKDINIFLGERDLKLSERFSTNQVQLETGEWVVARPIGYISLKHRIKCALKVFNGEADIVVWKQKESK